LIRMLTLSVSNVGGNAGRLTALSTLGSFAGTILIGYVLIPLLPNSTTMYLTAVVLMLIAAGYFFTQRAPGENKPPVAIVLLLGAGLGYPALAHDRWQGREMEELFRGNSNFGQLQ